MSNKIKKWLRAALIRAVKTFAQTAASMITVGEIVSAVDWEIAVSTGIVAAAYSLLTSVAGLPEVKKEG